MLIALLYAVCFLIFAVLILEGVFWLLAALLEITVPPKIRKLAYALVAVLFVIYCLVAVLPALHLPPLPR